LAATWLEGIAVTGQTSETHRVLGQEAGSSYPLKKPVNIRHLENAIIAIIDSPSGIASCVFSRKTGAEID
jgi:DNA-binding response OmpR family regulator